MGIGTNSKFVFQDLGFDLGDGDIKQKMSRLVEILSNRHELETHLYIRKYSDAEYAEERRQREKYYALVNSPPMTMWQAILLISAVVWFGISLISEFINLVGQLGEFVFAERQVEMYKRDMAGEEDDSDEDGTEGDQDQPIDLQRWLASPGKSN
jgi:hypothetical protein